MDGQRALRAASMVGHHNLATLWVGKSQCIGHWSQTTGLLSMGSAAVVTVEGTEDLILSARLLSLGKFISNISRLFSGP